MDEIDEDLRQVHLLINIGINQSMSLQTSIYQMDSCS